MEIDLATFSARRRTKSKRVTTQESGGKSPRIRNRFSSQLPKKCLNKLILQHIEDKPITIEYDKNYQIEFIHHEIIKRLENNIGICEQERKIEQLQDALTRVNTIVEQKTILRQIKEIKKDIRFTISGDKLEAYLIESHDIVEEFISLGAYVETISFDTDEVEEEGGAPADICNDDIQRLNVIERYIKVAKKYAVINAIRVTNTPTDKCINCGADMSDIAIGEAGEQVCPECQTTRHAYNISGHQGIKKNTDPRRYDVASTFRRELTQFQGLEKVYIPADVYQMLTDHLTDIGLPSPDVIRQMPLDEYGKREGTSLKVLIEALKAIGYNSLYKHSNLIGKTLWGWELHDLKDLIPLIMDDFNVIQKQFTKIDKDSRSSNICSQHRLLQQLRLRGVKVAITDFKLPGAEALESSEEIWRRMLELTDYPYIPLFPEKTSLGQVGTIQIEHEDDDIEVF